MLGRLDFTYVRRSDPEWHRRLIGNRVTDVERILRAKDLLQRHVDAAHCNPALLAHDALGAHQCLRQDERSNILNLSIARH